MPKEAVIPGGGLVGQLMAVFLARQGWRVKLFEKYADPRTRTVECARSINLTLSLRGEHALSTAGLLELVKAHIEPAYGRVVYDENGREISRTTYGEKGESIGSIQRSKLSMLLLEAAESMENVEVFFQHELINCDFEAGEALIRDTSGGGKVDKKFAADLFVGADGAHSAMRCEMMKQRKLELMEFKYHDHGYMEMFIPAPSSTSGKGEYPQMDNNMLHVCPKDTFTLICLPNSNGTFSGTLVMPFPLFDQALASPSALIDFFRKNFPRVLSLVGEKELVGQFKPGQDERRTPCRLVSLKCQPYHVSGTRKRRSNFVLVGDAAHAMVPFYGQGMNTGFEDCLVLMEKLKQNGWESPENIGKALEDFSTVRCQDGQAMADIAYQHYNTLCRGVKGSRYSVRRHVDRIFHRLFKESWVPEYTMVVFSQKPFSECRKECQRQDAILRWTLIGVILFLALVIGVVTLASR